MKIVVSGSSGFVGSNLVQFLSQKGHQVYPLYNRNKVEYPNALNCNLTDINAIADVINTSLPDAFVHCAAMTNVDECERQKLDCWLINVLSSINICNAINKNIRLVYISTAQVFDGVDKNYSEQSIKNPINWYGTTKSMSEDIVRNLANKWTIIRLGNQYGFDPQGRNFIHYAFAKLTRNEPVRAAADKVASFTYIDTTIKAINEIITNEIGGIYHIADMEATTKYGILSKLARIVDKENLVVKEQAANLFEAKRPDDTSLSVTKFLETLKSSRPLQLNDGLVKFVEKFRASVPQIH